ncbi:pitrilysin family protein [Luteipulveratus sp. YIM 133132]|uniref:Pitrilysin family protein n=1 Tax=Luteipulveratus flavus TaxID=3031728 RepID=A0ABT6C9S6_9MICO|nr:MULTISPECIES: pitrilysin family protein [unclassified Luteipulveratus]MDE9365870.1 pitrilysin family protein [Luteipulveratus sp. YIM 133132]MDF8265062.1 pitrilysin family protein [Luteipulveratus sp. YIM 133296]
MSTPARPDVAPPEPWAFPAPAEHRLSNGMRALVYRLPGQHVASTRIALPSLLSGEPRSREGVASIVSRTMDEGTRSHTGEELAELFERNGIGLGAGVTEQGLVVEVEATTARLGRALELTTECLGEPVFDGTEVRRHVRQRLSEIDHERAGAASRAALEWARTFYTDDSRGSRPTAGARDTVEPIESADCASYHRSWVRPEGGTVVVAGDVDDAAVVDELERTIGAWDAEPASTATDLADARDVRDPQSQRIVFVDRPGSVQTEMYVGTLGPNRRAEGGWAAYPALSFVLGGSPGARVDALLREEKGYTYGMRTVFRPRRHDGVFVAAGSVRGDVTAESLELLVGVLESAAEGFTQEETRSAIDYIGMTAPARYATADAVADEAVRLRLDGLGTGFVTDYLQQVRDLTPERLQEAWAAVVGSWTTVLVGDAEQHADAVRALGLGEVTVIA